MRYAVFVLSILLSSQVHAAGVDDVLSKLQEKYKNMDTLQASFTQSYQSKRFSEGLTEKGVVYLGKGGRMKWDYQKPERKIFLSDGFFYFYYVPADRQVVKTPVNHQDNQQSPALFLAGRGDFGKDFKAEWADPRQASRIIKLTPLNPQPDFQHLIVEVDPVRNLILRLLVIDALDNRTEYKFTNILENPSIPENFFLFQTPPGTDVILQRTE